MMSSDQRGHHRAVLDEDRGRLPVEDGRRGTPCTFLATLSRNRELRYGPTTGRMAARTLPPPSVQTTTSSDSMRAGARQVARGAGHQEAVGQRAAVAQVGIEALAPLLDVPCAPARRAGGRRPATVPRSGPPPRRSSRRRRGGGRRPARAASAPRAAPGRPATASRPARPPPSSSTTTGSGSHGPA